MNTDAGAVPTVIVSVKVQSALATKLPVTALGPAAAPKMLLPEKVPTPSNCTAPTKYFAAGGLAVEPPETSMPYQPCRFAAVTEQVCACTRGAATDRSSMAPVMNRPRTDVDFIAGLLLKKRKRANRRRNAIILERGSSPGAAS